MKAEEMCYTLSKVTAMKSDYICYNNAKKLAKDLRLDKGEEYLLGTGRHAAIIRRNEKGYLEYLELQ